MSEHYTEVSAEYLASLHEQVRKAEALAADRELALKQRDEAQELRDKYGTKLAQLQQDVRPLLEIVRMGARIGYPVSKEALETFLAKHPECKP